VTKVPRQRERALQGKVTGATITTTTARPVAATSSAFRGITSLIGCV